MKSSNSVWRSDAYFCLSIRACARIQWANSLFLDIRKLFWMSQKTVYWTFCGKKNLLLSSIRPTIYYQRFSPQEKSVPILNETLTVSFKIGMKFEMTPKVKKYPCQKFYVILCPPKRNKPGNKQYQTNNLWQKKYIFLLIRQKRRPLEDSNPRPPDYETDASKLNGPKNGNKFDSLCMDSHRFTHIP